MGVSVAIAIIGIVRRALLLSSQAGDSGRIEKSLQAAARPALQQVVRGRDLRLPLRQRPGARAAAVLLGAFDRNVVDGGVNGAGWLTRFSSQRLDLVGYLDHRWRGALRLVLREAALLPGLHAADRPRAGLRVLRGGRACWCSSDITWRGNYMDQHLLSIVLFTPLAGLLVLLLIPSARTRT